VAGNADLAGMMVALAKQGMRVHRDDEGTLLRALTEPVGDRPTLRVGLIERLGPALAADLHDRTPA
jgi:hypothetical protein